MHTQSNSHCAHVSIETREYDLSAIGTTVDGSEYVISEEVAIEILDVGGGHVLAGIWILDLDVEANVARNLLEQLQRGKRHPCEHTKADPLRYQAELEN